MKKVYGIVAALAPVLMIVGISQADLSTGLVACYSFDIGGRDDSGNGHDGTPTPGIEHITSGQLSGSGAYYNGSTWGSYEYFDIHVLDGKWNHLDSYAFDVKEYLSECLELFDNKKVFGRNENFKYL